VFKNTNTLNRSLRIIPCMLLAISLSVPAWAKPAGEEEGFHKGICFTTWTKEKFASRGAKQALGMFRNMGAGHVQINVTKYQKRFDSLEIKATERTPENGSIVKAINAAHKIGLKVMLKPHIDIMDTDGGNFTRKDIGFHDDVSWQIWFKEYEKFIIHYAKMAERTKTETFCIGTELSFASRKTEFWTELISKVKAVYSGELTYAANWDNYKFIEFWEELDYAGINAYFPLTEERSPTIEEIKAGWREWIQEIEAWHAKVKKPIIFTELGYASSSHAASRPWKGDVGKADMGIQARCYTAFFEIVWWRKWFKGVYWWNFKPMIYGGGRRDRGFTPMNKPAMKILRKWYNSERLVFENQEEQKSSLEVSFDCPKNLHNKFIQFKIKAREEIKAIRFVLRDRTTRCSPDIYLDNITKKWKTFAINIEKESFDFVDTTHIDNIRFEILSPECAGKNLGSILLVEEIKVF